MLVAEIAFVDLKHPLVSGLVIAGLAASLLHSLLHYKHENTIMIFKGNSSYICNY